MSNASAPSRPGYRAVLRNREFRALWLTHVTSVLGNQVTLVVLAALVLERTGSVALSALSFAVMFLPWVIGAPLLSLAADRYPRRTVMVSCDVGRGLLLLVMALPVMPVWGLFVAATLCALLGPPFEAARGATVPDVLSAELYPVGQSLQAASLQVSQLLGFGLGGVLVTTWPGSWALCVDGVSFLLSALVLRRCVAWRPGQAGGVDLSARSWLQQCGEGLTVVGRSAELRTLLLLCCVVAAVTVVPESLAVAQARTYEASALTAALLCAALPLGSAAGVLIAGRWTPDGNRLAGARSLAVLACAVCAACLLQPSLPVLLALWVLAGAGAGSMLRANVAFVLRVAPAVRGRALSVAQGALQVSQGLCVAGAGLLAGVVGPVAAVGWTGLLGVAAVLLLLRRWPDTLLHDGAPEVQAPQGQQLAAAA